MMAHLAWGPSRAVYVRRAAIVGALTFAFFMLPALASVVFDWQEWQFFTASLLMPFAMTLIFVLEDYSRWRGIRDERWEVEDAHLMHDGAEGRSMIALAEIAQARKRLGNVVLFLHSGQRIVMRHLDNPAGVAEQLNGLRQEVPPT